jgi:hypothetical protein
MSDKMLPILILPPGVMSESDKKKLASNFVCVVTAKDPSKVKFLDPIPSVLERTKPEQAAIELSRKILGDEIRRDDYGKIGRYDILNLYISCLTKGTSLDTRPSQAEREETEYNEERLSEVRKLAREDARKQREEKKKEIAKEKETKTT